MASEATGSNGAGDGHQQSIGAETNQPVDGIAGSNPGTQQPSGAHVDAGEPGAGPGKQAEEPAPVNDKGVHRSSLTPRGGLAGMSGRGVAQPGGATGALGSHAQARVAQLEQQADRMYAGNWNGSCAGGGKSPGVGTSSGSLSRQHSSGK